MEFIFANVKWVTGYGTLRKANLDGLARSALIEQFFVEDVTKLLTCQVAAEVIDENLG
jgi:hypothetical protein